MLGRCVKQEHTFEQFIIRKYMSVFKNIKSLFVVEEAGAASSSDKGKAKSVTKTPAAKSAPSEVSGSGAVRKGKVTPKFMDVLFSAMEKGNLDGFDYLEYKQSLQSLSKMPMDESTRYQSAFAMAQTMGATPEQLVNSAGHYIKLLQAEEQKFEHALANQQEQHIGGKQKQAADLNITIKTKEEAILKLQKEIEQAKQKQKSLKAEVEKAASKVEVTKNDFMASYHKLVSQITADVEAMKKYLK